MSAYIGIYLIFPVLRICLEGKEGEKAISILFAILVIFCAGISFVNYIQRLMDYFIGFNSGLISFDNIQEFNVFGNYANCLMWFLFGYLIYRKSRNDISLRIQMMSLVIFLFGWLLIFFRNCFDNTVGDVGIYTSDMYKSFPVMLSSGGLFLWLTATARNKSNPLITFVGSNTWGIYMLHIIIRDLFFNYILRFIPFTGIGMNFLIASWMLTVSTLVVYCMRKLFVIKYLVVF